MRKQKDKSDAEMARNEFSEEEFNSLFSYRKSGKIVVMTKDQDVARCYRRQINQVEYWDEDPEFDYSDDEGSLDS